MSKEFFKVKKGINLDPISSSSVSSPEVGDIIVDSSDNNKLKRYDGVTASWKDVGSGVGGINYISTNSDFEGGTTGYARYANTVASVSPETGTGGSPNPAFTFTATTSSPLRGTKSGLITKDAASRQGHGVSYDFTIDSADKAQILTISFDYNTEVSSTNYADGDIRVYVYDVTNSRLIEVVDRDLYASSFGKFVGTFQTSPDSTSYRLIFHVASINPLAYTVEIDNVIVGPQTIVKGAIVTDWQAYTPTISNVTASSVNAWYRRVGGSIEIKGDISVTSVTGTPIISLPTGLSIDTSITGASNVEQLGIATYRETGTRSYPCHLAYSTSTQLIIQTQLAISGTYVGSGSTGSTTPFTWDATDFITFQSFSIPIAGWSSNVVLSEDAGNREIAARYERSAAQSIPTADATPMQFDSKIFDTTNSFSGDTYTIPESGIYQAHFNSSIIGSFNAGNIHSVAISQNGYFLASSTDEFATTTTVISRLGTSCIFEAQKGDLIKFTVFQNTGVSLGTEVNATGGANSMSIAKLSSPQTIAASEIVHLNTATNNSTISISSSDTILIYEDIREDTHNAYNISNGVYTAPQTGFYNIQASAGAGGITLTTAAALYIQICINNLTNIYQNFTEGNGGASVNYQVHINNTLHLSKGDTIDIRVRASTASGSILGAVRYNTLTITKVG